MVNERKGTILRRKDDRYLPYLPVREVDDSMFPSRNGQKKPGPPSIHQLYLTDKPLFSEDFQ